MENKNFLTKKRLIIFLLILYFFLPFWVPALGGVLGILLDDEQWIYFSSESKEGKVVETETGKPIEGAIVIANWGLSCMWHENPLASLVRLSPLFFLYQPGYREMAKEVILSTDNNGEFKIPSWKSFQPRKYSYTLEDHNKPYIRIYKPGYDLIRAHQVNTRILYKLTMSLDVKDIVKIFDDFFDGIYAYNSKQECMTVANLIQINIADLPQAPKNKIQKKINYYRELLLSGEKK
jgi:hypothetical protein